MSRSWPRLLTRVTTAVLAVQVLLQPVLAGGFLSGHYDLLRMHMINGMTMIVVALVQGVAAVFLFRGGAPRSVLTHGFMVPLAIAATALLGEYRLLILHIPIGVLMVIGILQMASEVWRKEKADARTEEVPV